MKQYDFDKVKQLISQYTGEISSASLGMHEDWFWTAETVWENGKFNKDLPTTADANSVFYEYVSARKSGMSILSDGANKYDVILIGGLFGSDWATPTLQLIFHDGSDKMIPCFQGDDSIPFDEKVATTATKQAELLGCLSGPVQERITPLSQD